MSSSSEVVLQSETISSAIDFDIDDLDETPLPDILRFFAVRFFHFRCLLSPSWSRDVGDSAGVGDEGTISPCTSNLLDVVVGVGRVADNDDIINIGEVDSNHEDIGSDNDPAAVLFPHEPPRPKAVVWPVQGAAHPQLFTPDAGGGS